MQYLKEIDQNWYLFFKELVKVKNGIIWLCYLMTNVVNNMIMLLQLYVHLFLILPNGDMDLIA